MQYRQFGKLDWKVSAFGFGAMRFPMKKEGEKMVVDDVQAIDMIRYAIDHGVNYVDTAYPYHEGQSEVIVGKALKDSYRAKVKVATKLPCWEVQTADDFDKYLDIQLKRLQLDHVDVYLLHSLNRHSWPKMRDIGIIKRAEKAISDGRIGYLGFSFHDDHEAFQPIVDGYDWTMCQIQYNFIDIENQAGTMGLQYAAAKGIAVVVMEPLLGGKLPAPPPSIQAIWDGAGAKRTPVAWALQWLWNQPEVATVLSGVSNMAQTHENVALADAARIGALTVDELALYPQVRAKYQELTAISCTSCKYCLPCPQGVDIPGNFAAYNEGLMYDKPDNSRGQYGWWKYAYEVQKIFDHDIRAAVCVVCGECEAKCPQSIPISKWMPVIHQVLGENRPYVRALN